MDLHMHASLTYVATLGNLAPESAAGPVRVLDDDERGIWLAGWLAGCELL